MNFIQNVLIFRAMALWSRRGRFRGKGLSVRFERHERSLLMSTVRSRDWQFLAALPRPAFAKRKGS